MRNISQIMQLDHKTNKTMRCSWKDKSQNLSKTTSEVENVAWCTFERSARSALIVVCVSIGAFAVVFDNTTQHQPFLTFASLAILSIALAYTILLPTLQGTRWTMREWETQTIITVRKEERIHTSMHRFSMHVDIAYRALDMVTPVVNWYQETGFGDSTWKFKLNENSGHVVNRAY